MKITNMQVRSFGASSDSFRECVQWKRRVPGLELWKCQGLKDWGEKRLFSEKKLKGTASDEKKIERHCHRS